MKPATFSKLRKVIGYAIFHYGNLRKLAISRCWLVTSSDKATQALSPAGELGAVRWLNRASTRRVRLQERALAKLVERLSELVGRVHHDRAAPGHGLLQWLPRNQQEAHPLLPRLHRDFVAAVK